MVLMERTELKYKDIHSQVEVVYALVAMVMVNVFDFSLDFLVPRYLLLKI